MINMKYVLIINLGRKKFPNGLKGYGQFPLNILLILGSHVVRLIQRVNVASLSFRFNKDVTVVDFNGPRGFSITPPWGWSACFPGGTFPHHLKLSAKFHVCVSIQWTDGRCSASAGFKEGKRHSCFDSSPDDAPFRLNHREDVCPAASASETSVCSGSTGSQTLCVILTRRWLAAERGENRRKEGGSRWKEDEFWSRRKSATNQLHITGNEGWGRKKEDGPLRWLKQIFKWRSLIFTMSSAHHSRVFPAML